MLLTRRADIAIVLFSLLLFPGILLHEGSHYLMAHLLGVRTGGFSLIPRPMADGRLQLGYVETVRADPLREALIGVAPLLSGGAFVAYAGLMPLGLLALWERVGALGWQVWLAALPDLAGRPDFWLWFYLVLAVSSTMMPSAADRDAWRPLALFAGLLLVVALLVGAGPWMLANLAPLVDLGLWAAALVFGISALVHLLLLPPVWGLHRLLSWLMGVDVA